MTKKEGALISSSNLIKYCSLMWRHWKFNQNFTILVFVTVYDLQCSKLYCKLKIASPILTNISLDIIRPFQDPFKCCQCDITGLGRFLMSISYNYNRHFWIFICFPEIFFTGLFHSDSVSNSFFFF